MLSIHLESARKMDHGIKNKKKTAFAVTKYYNHNHQRLSWVDLLIACYCHCQWKGLPWLHTASTPVCLYMLHIPDFYNSLLHSPTPNTPNNLLLAQGANVHDSFMVIDLWSMVSMLGHTGCQNTGFMLQLHIGACTREYYLRSSGTGLCI